MSGYPVILDGSKLSALVVGGGAVATRKVRALLDGGVRVKVVAIAVESHPEAPELAQAAAATFSRWEHTIALSLRNGGVEDEQEALAIAGLILAAVEGATVMARATGGREPLVRVGQQLASLLRMRLDSAVGGVGGD